MLNVIFHVRLAENVVLKQHMVHWKSVHFHAHSSLVFLRSRDSSPYYRTPGKSMEACPMRTLKQPNYILGTNSIMRW